MAKAMQAFIQTATSSICGTRSCFGMDGILSSRNDVRFSASFHSTWKKGSGKIAGRSCFPPNRRACWRHLSAGVFSQRISAVTKVEETQLEVVKKYTEIVPDTVIGDDFERFAPTAATVTSSLLLGISSLPDAKYDGAIESALAYGKCMLDQNKNSRLSCFLDKALVNVGAELTRVVTGRVSTEIDPRLAHDTNAIIDKVRLLIKLYSEVEVPQDRLLFKIPATWEGIEAARQLEDDGIQTHITGVNSFAQAAACAQAQASVIQVAVGRVRDWARTHSGDNDIDAAVKADRDPGVELVRRAHAHINKLGHRTKIMASNIRSKNDVLALLGVDYVIVPLKVLEALRESSADEESLIPTILANQTDTATYTSDDKWDKQRFEQQLGLCAEQLLAAELESAVVQTLRVEEYFSKIWPPPNV
eukprot:TRINITY_DN225_c0_g1_i2.p1 TRINITY_DN225_c0_g1~~TRINITY_DN225_c0_g1_i2.p1  ORF type:complete len:418 (-),score=76.73 TRINITY_DN225_c0_g1_i2:295-1548(-)